MRAPWRELLMVAACAVVARAAVAGDEVKKVPGFAGVLPSKMYSGHIAVNGDTTKAPTRFLHYWLVLSEQHPHTDPLLLWLNGGPGCSSMDGFIFEQGPLHFADQVQSTAHGPRHVRGRHSALRRGRAPSPALVLNEHRWTRFTNMLFLESPVGVGFSYDTTNQYFASDNTTADENFVFLQRFFLAYPELSQNPFYITGESYAGVYIPMLAERVWANNEAAAPAAKINLQGLMVGNGCTGSGVGICKMLRDQYASVPYLLDYFHGHGFISQAQYDEASACDWASPSPACEDLYYKLEVSMGVFNAYNVYEDCAADPYVHKRVMSAGKKRFQYIRGTPGCVDDSQAWAFFNDAAVQKAIHVTGSAVNGSWVLCSDELNYDNNIDSVIPIYQALLPHLHILIFNGEADSVVPYVDNEQWTTALGLEPVVLWQQWTIEGGAMGGYASTYKPHFSFITIQQAGHMVPQSKPLQALVMLQLYLNGTTF